MVKKIFWQDPYLTELNTTVHSVAGNQVTLNETIFYAFSGGQESDAGSIGPKGGIRFAVNAVTGHNNIGENRNVYTTQKSAPNMSQFTSE